MHVDVQLRWSDMDAQRHVNNARIADYLQEARVQLLRDADLLELGVVVVRQQVQYRGSIDYADDPLDVELGVTALRAGTVEIGYLLRQEGVVVAEARTLLSAFDFAEQRPRRFTDRTRAALERHRVAMDPFPELTAPALEGRGIRTLHHPRWTDLDRYGHVNNMLAFEYLQQARIEVSPQWDPFMARTGSGDSPYLWLVVRQGVDHVAQIHHPFEPLQMWTAPVRIGRTSLTSAAEICDPDGTLLVRGRTVVVCADQTFRPTPLPNADRLRDHLVR